MTATETVPSEPLEHRALRVAGARLEQVKQRRLAEEGALEESRQAVEGVEAVSRLLNRTGRAARRDAAALDAMNGVVIERSPRLLRVANALDTSRHRGRDFLAALRGDMSIIGAQFAQDAARLSLLTRARKRRHARAVIVHAARVLDLETVSLASVGEARIELRRALAELDAAS